MPTATDMRLSRRECLAWAAGLLGGPAWCAGASARPPAASHARLLGAWQCEPQHSAEAARYQVGMLATQPDALVVARAIDVPTRAHGLLTESGGTVLAVARRPGDWLLRWDPRAAPGVEPQMAWIEPDRAFNGHVAASRDGHHLYTTETDLESGAGLIGVRDAVTLDKLAEWPTHGVDPHELLLDADGHLLVANGGVPTRPETGRQKAGLERMDASLVRLHPGARGAMLGQWRLPDARLSLRHLAWGGPDGRLLGIALQAEHDDPTARQAAPVLALFDGKALRTAAVPQPLAGYGGDIAWANAGFSVSAPRVDAVGRWNAAGEWLGTTPLAEACALAGDSAGLWVGGRGAALAVDGDTIARRPTPAVRLDNHWLHWA